MYELRFKHYLHDPPFQQLSLAKQNRSARLLYTYAICFVHLLQYTGQITSDLMASGGSGLRVTISSGERAVSTEFSHGFSQSFQANMMKVPYNFPFPVLSSSPTMIIISSLIDGK
jgi:hypothetical protein